MPRNLVQTGRRGGSVRMNRRLERDAIPRFDLSFASSRLISLAKSIASAGGGRDRERGGNGKAVFDEGGNTLRATEKKIYIYINI